MQITYPDKQRTGHLIGVWFIVCLLAFICIRTAYAQTTPSLPQLLTYQTTSPDSTAPSGERVNLNTQALNRALPASELQFTAPNGQTYTFVTDRNSTSPSGTTHWVAQLKNKGDDYRAIITYSQGNAFGNIHTPDGNFRLHMQDGELRLIDVYAAERRTPLFHSPPLIAPPPPAQPQTQKSAPSVQRLAQAAEGGMTTIDLMVVYTDGLSNKLGADIMQTRIEHLVAVSNQAYIDSKVNVQLRLVYSEKVSYSDQNGHDAALRAITDGDAPFNNIANLRTSYGADLVTLLKQKDTTADNWCGLAWGLGYNGEAMNPANAYSVVSVGDDIVGTKSFCSDYTLPHELGHNMGSAHDRANTNTPGAYPYSYGYGIEGRFGDIMSYFTPTVGKFSNPAVICSTQNDACGISESDPNNAANNALSLNNTAPKVAAFTLATTLDTTPDNLFFTSLIGATAGTTSYSEVVTISGTSTAVGISISGAQYSINGGAFTDAPGQISSGQTVQIKLQTSSTSFGVATALLTVGTVTRPFRVVSAPSQFTNAPAVSAGFAHSLALRADGTVWAWGDNSLGAIGNVTTTTKQNIPVQVTGLTNVVQVSAGGDASLALKSDGTVWGWGNNRYGQAGTITSQIVTQAKPVAGLSAIKKIAAGYFDALALDASGNVWYWGLYKPTPVKVSGISSAIDIAAGNDHRLALLQNGTVLAWGQNTDGQLGVGNTTSNNTPTALTTISNIKAIAAGEAHSMALRGDGTVWAWGNNSAGQLGDGTKTLRTTPVAVQDAQGANQMAGVVALGIGLNHSMAIKSDGSAWVWGDNTYGQFGNGSIDSQNRPIKLSLSNLSQLTGHSSHTLALQNDSIVWAWGLNNHGNLGDGTLTWRKEPIAVAANSQAPYWWIGQIDQEPTAFSANSGTAEAGAAATSQALIVSGINQATPISILGGQYSINDGAFTGSAGMVGAGQSVKVRITASAITGASNSAWLTIGGVTSIYTVTATAPTQVVAAIEAQQGWNLLGNGLDAPIKVATALSNASKVQTAWKWISGSSQWAFYAPSLSGQAYTDYLVSKGYAALDNIEAGEGFWVNAKESFSITHTAAKPVTASQLAVKIIKGWNLLTVGDAAYTPTQLNQALGSKVNTLWTWDNPLSQWYFYAPTLEAAGTLTAYTQTKNYLDFVVKSKLVEKNTGFWLNN